MLELAEAPAEGELLPVVERLIVEDEHRELVHAGVDGGHLVAREGLAEVEVVDFGGEARADLTRLHSVISMLLIRPSSMT